MKTGLVLGKFMPIHNGHIALIDFAKERCDNLIIWVCFTEKEPIPGKNRYNWVKSIYENQPKILPIAFEYDEKKLSDSSVSSIRASKQWAEAINTNLPPIDIIFTSEQYGDYIADLLGIEHISFDKARERTPISSSAIRQNPLKYWDFLPQVVRPYYVKKICIVGTESTGKTTMANELAVWFKTNAVTEAAREIVEVTEKCTYIDLVTIASAHAKAINTSIKVANKILFIDTDINITKSYSHYLFGKDLLVDEWIEEANTCDLYLFLENDAPYIQDGTRLSKNERDKLNQYHKAEFRSKGIEFSIIDGTVWEERLQNAKDIICNHFENLLI